MAPPFFNLSIFLQRFDSHSRLPHFCERRVLPSGWPVLWNTSRGLGIKEMSRVPADPQIKTRREKYSEKWKRQTAYGVQTNQSNDSAVYACLRRPHNGLSIWSFSQKGVTLEAFTLPQLGANAVHNSGMVTNGWFTSRGSPNSTLVTFDLRFCTAAFLTVLPIEGTERQMVQTTEGIFSL